MISRSSVGGAFPLKRLGEVVEFLDSERRPVTESDRRPGPYPYFGANGQQGTIDDFIFDEPLVLLAEDGGHFDDPQRGIAYRIAGKTWVNNHAHVLRPRAGIDLGFLVRVLENYDVTPFVTGTTRGKLTKAGAAEILVPVPPLPDQQRIAEVLDRTEALRAKRRAALAALDTLTQSIFLDLFGDPVTNPKGWPVVGIAGVCELIVDCVNRTAPIVEETTPYKMIRTTNVRNGRVDLADVRYVTEETFHRWNRRATPRRGDVLLTREAPVGEAGILDLDDRVFLGQRLMLYRVDPRRITPEFLLFSFRGGFLQNQFARHGSGTTVKHLPLPACRSFEVRVPPLSVQHDFSRRVAAVEKLKPAHRSSLAEMDALFASLQHRAFRGEL